jgi:bifunctional UDP-N-acetylglucosamine pyrophosphorylase/glucosamine-1-phosphate N-acetyltransferase
VKRKIGARKVGKARRARPRKARPKKRAVRRSVTASLPAARSQSPSPASRLALSITVQRPASPSSGAEPARPATPNHVHPLSQPGVSNHAPATGHSALPKSAYLLRPMGVVPQNGPLQREAGRGEARRETVALILAAGLGKRMQSKWSKLLHPIAGRPMVRHVVEATRGAGVSRTVVVIGNQADEVRQAVGDHDKKTAFAFQKEQLGTGHAVLCAERQMQGHRGDVLILNGDLPALRPETLKSFVSYHRAHGAPLSLLTTVIPDPRGYGRVIRNYGGDVSRVVEEADAGPEERATQEINCGIYCVDFGALFRPLRRATRDNAQGEIYVTDLVELLRKEGRKVAAYRHPDPKEVLGVNDRAELAAAARALYRRKAESLMAAGVTLLDPDTTYIDMQVEIGRDSVIEPGVMILGQCQVGTDTRIGVGTRIADSSVGTGTEILPYCVIASSRIGRGCRIGPFAHLRPETQMDDEARVGNFVEIKKSRLGRGSKANHLSYLGDAEIGRDVNIGAGTITCNFDGIAKHRTVIEDEVFIGSDTQLVAPVRVRRGAFIGAGSTITKDVPSHALALSRARQENKEGWAKRFGPAARKDGSGHERG